jgi:hypothetical protein
MIGTIRKSIASGDGAFVQVFLPAHQVLAAEVTYHGLVFDKSLIQIHFQGRGLQGVLAGIYRTFFSLLSSPYP